MTRTALVSVLVCLAIAAPAARADVFQSNGSSFLFEIDNVPDFDQRRIHLPAYNIMGLPNFGKYYCVPASSLNWLTYIANHGYTNVAPGPGNWAPPESQSTYNFISGVLFLLGLGMGTTAYGGTGSPLATLEVWLEVGAPGQFDVIEAFVLNYWSPRVQEAASWAIAGGLVNLGIGWYTNAQDFNLPHMRAGGHAVTLPAADGMADSGGTVYLHDPNSESPKNLTTQSKFVKNPYTWQPVSGFFCGMDANGFPANCYERVQDKLSYFAGYVDSFIVILPKYGLSYEQNQIYLLKPVQLTSRPQRAMQAFASAGSLAVLDMAVNPLRPSHPYVVEGSNVIWRIDAVSGESRRFAEASLAPQRLAYGGTEEDLYVLTTRTIEWFRRNGTRGGSIELPAKLDAFAYDERNRRLVGASRAARSLYFFALDLRLTGTAPIPDSVIGGSGKLMLSIAPRSGEVWMLTEHERVLHRVAVQPGSPIRIQAVPVPAEAGAPDGLSVDNHGVVYLTAQRLVYPLDEQGRLLRSSKFFRLAAGRGIQVSRSFSNFDSRVHTGPGWRNVLPPEEDASAGAP